MCRSILYLLSLAIAVSCFAGRPAGGADATVLRVATFQCDVTPPLGEAIYSSYLPLATVEHPLLAKGIVLDDGRRRYVLCAVDWCELCNSTHTLFRRKMAEAAYGDCGPGYICTEKAFDEGGYEPTDSLVAPQSESLVKTAIRQLLGLE